MTLVMCAIEPSISKTEIQTEIDRCLQKNKFLLSAKFLKLFYFLSLRYQNFATMTPNFLSSQIS